MIGRILAWFKPAERELEADDDPDWDPAAPVELPIDGVLDLHNFHPREVGELLPDYLAACAERGLTSARIIHGKGTGALKRRVHAILDRSPLVSSYGPAEGGNWGATLVELKVD